MSDPLPQKTCTKCDEDKDLSEFYKRPTGRDGLSSQCKDCTNGKHRKPTLTRIVRGRALTRAKARLVKIHQAEFDALYEEEMEKAIREAEVLAAAAPKPTADVLVPAEPESVQDIPRLRTGQRREGQTVEQRIDVSWCEKCHEYHDSGHQCQRCAERARVVAAYTEPLTEKQRRANRLAASNRAIMDARSGATGKRAAAHHNNMAPREEAG